MKTSVLLVLAFVCFALGQTMIDRITIDDFTVGTNSIVISIPATNLLPVTDTAIFTSTNIAADSSSLIGGERDLQLTVETGPAGRVITSQVLDGEYSIATPNSASGFSLIQWDGVDGSLNVDNSGLGGIDLTEAGLGTRFHTVIESDLATQYTFSVYSPNGGLCERQINIPADPGNPVDYFIPYSDFTDGCDFTSVGAIEILIEAFDNVDTTMTVFATNGVNDPSATRTPAPSASRTPAAVPSASSTPSFIPSASAIPPPPPDKCMCHCPAFTCELIFDPDDDENNAYYFDDDDNNNNGGNGNNGSNSGNTSDFTGSNLTGSNYLESGSNAAVLKASAVCIIVALVALI